MSLPLLYTEVDTHRASLRERAFMLRLIWLVAGDDDVPTDSRRKVRRIAVLNALKFGATCSTYVTSRGLR